jgi:hypothetical protein
MPTSSTDFKPAFQAERVNGKFTRMVMHIEEDVRKVGPNGDKSIITRKLVPKKEEFSDGWMIYFPQGHSMFVAADDADQLNRIGVGDRPKIVDMNSGDEVPDNLNLSPKEIVEQAQHNRPRAARSTGGLTEVMEGNLDA